MSNLWPYSEAKKILESRKDKNTPIIFETGYGPSGLPHIGTFGEVARTTWVRKAFEKLSGKKTRLIAFSDDMDALRRVPDNIPNKEILENSIGIPLCNTPNPFDTEHKSFSDHNNDQLKSFLDSFNFDYEFISSSDYYKSGKFNYSLKRLAEKHEEVCLVIRPTLRGDRSNTWSPFMPIHPITGIVMEVPVTIDPINGTVTWKDEDDIEYITSIYDGNCKIGWKVDWALRWYTFGVDYEMSGKDLIDSVKISSKVCRILGGVPPVNLTYELFLDSEGGKISKSKGNGFTFEEWMNIGNKESLSLFMFNNPTRAKRIYPSIVQQSVDDYIKYNNSYIDKNDENNPLDYFISRQDTKIDITYQLLLNLISASNSSNVDQIKSYLSSYSNNIDVEFVDNLINKVFNYYKEYIVDTKVYRIPTDEERKAILELRNKFASLVDLSLESLQFWSYEIGKTNDFVIKDWFKLLYEVLLGQSSGPKFWVFTNLYGVENTINLIDEKLKG